MNSNTHSRMEEINKPVSTTQRFADERIQELSCEALYRSQDIDATDIRLTVVNGIVHLDGTVQNEEAFTVVESCLRNISDIRDIENNLEVRSALH